MRGGWTPPRSGSRGRRRGRRSIRGLLAVSIALALGLGARAAAEEPAFTFLAPDSTKSVTWKATAQVGVNATTGNAPAVALSMGGSVSRRSGFDRLSLETSAGYTRARVWLATDSNGTPGIGPNEIRSVEQTTARWWSLKLRYDRFFTQRNSLYAAISGAGDEPAGKELVGGGQVGYSRELLHLDHHILTLEAGYDVSYQNYVASPRAVTIHSTRLFAGYELRANSTVGLRLGTEWLTNMSGEAGPTGFVGPLHDNRVNGKAELNVKVFDRGALGFRWRAAYTSSPAPRPPPPGTSYEPGYLPLADKLDTTNELVFTLALL